MLQNEGIWVFVEHQNGQLEETSWELLGLGRTVADKLSMAISAVVLGSDVITLVSTLRYYNLDKIFVLESPAFAQYSPEPYVEILSKLILERAPKIVLGNATIVGNDVFPRLAARLETGLVLDCVALEVEENSLLVVTKPTHGGKVYSKITWHGAGVAMATIKGGIAAPKLLRATRQADVVHISPRLEREEPRAKVIGFIKGDRTKLGVDEVDIIVSGGRGVGDAANFRLLQELAELLGGSVAGSRVAVDNGWVGTERQIGQTGKTIVPKLYIACGISGSSHHTMGMKDSGTVIAIDTDRYAPIFKLADMAIVGDLRELLPEIIKRLRQQCRPPD